MAVKKPKTTQAPPLVAPTTPETPDLRPPAAPPQAAYWRGRDFPRKPGTKRAKAQPMRTTSSAPADLRPRTILPGLLLDSTSKEEKAGEVIRNVELLQEFEQFKTAILPAVAEDLKRGLSAEDILRKYQAVAAAKMVSLIPSEREGYAASRDILDRSLGKAIERKAIKHQFEELDERQLDAMIESKLKDIEGTVVGDDDNE